MTDVEAQEYTQRVLNAVLPPNAGLGPIQLFWFRRDLRLGDNHGLYRALKSSGTVLPLFIFDSTILRALPAFARQESDKRVEFIWQTLQGLRQELQKHGSELLVLVGEPVSVWKQIASHFEKNSLNLAGVTTNEDYEPYATSRDAKVANFLRERGANFELCKDQVLFAKNEILTEAGQPYTVFTPYKNKWLKNLPTAETRAYPSHRAPEKFFQVPASSKVAQALGNLHLKDLGFSSKDPAGSPESFPPLEIPNQILTDYSQKRDFPALQASSLLGLHLRFGTLSVRRAVREGQKTSAVWLSQLIWREFFMQILFHYPRVEKQSFRPAYEKVAWRDSAADLRRWEQGQTGYPMVDAGMRELNSTGHMHNRARMVVASFLTKHLLIHWYQGERYFAGKLLDFDLSANNGNWQWAAGTGCDAAPYFRVFNPDAQMKKFDPQLIYIKKWVPEFGTSRYTHPIVEHKFARERALSAFQKALKGVEK